MKGNHRYLPRRRGSANVRPVGLQLEVFGPGEVPTYRARMEYLHPNDLASSDAVGETAAYDLDLRKLGHDQCAGQRAATGPDPRLPFSAAKAMAAAFCSASFLFRPAPGP